MGMTVSGVGRATLRLTDIGDRAQNLGPIWPAVGKEVAEGFAEQFATGGTAGGRPWAPLKPSYLAWKISKGYSPATLIRTGSMMSTLISSPLDIQRTTRKSGEFGTSHPVMKYHHFGTKHMPQRRVVFWFQPMQNRVVEKIRHYLLTGSVT